MPPSSSTTTLSQQQQPPSQQLSIPLLDVIQNNNNKPQQNVMMSSYNEVKPVQNDFWFNETPLKQSNAVSPHRQIIKSLFSPSPEHTTQDDKTKYMMMTTTNVKRESTMSSLEIPKEEKKTPVKREKMSMGISAKPSPHMPIDKKFIKNELNQTSTVDLSSLSALSQDTSLINKKRPYSSVKDSLDAPSGSARGEKIRKTEAIKTMTESSHQTMSRMPQHFETLPPIGAKQPIETNPEDVKSLLKECFSSSNKFDPFDSPLDVIHSEPPEQLLAIPSLPPSNSSILNGEF